MILIGSWAAWTSCLHVSCSHSNLNMKIHTRSSTRLPAELPSLLHHIPLYCDLGGLGRTLTDVYHSVFTEWNPLPLLCFTSNSRIESGAKIPILISPDKVNQRSSIAIWHSAQCKQHTEQEIHNGFRTKMKIKQRVVFLFFCSRFHLICFKTSYARNMLSSFVCDLLNSFTW